MVCSIHAAHDPVTDLRAKPGCFLGAVTTPDLASAVVVGVPFDGSVTYRAGAREGPDAIRTASDSIEGYCPKLDRDLQDHRYCDLGNIDATGAAGSEPTPFDDVRVVTDLRAAVDALPDRPALALGGDHLIALPFIERCLRRHPRLQIIHIDAHADMREQWDGQRFNHATVMRRVLDALPADAAIHAWGIRSGLREEFQHYRSDRRLNRIPNTATAGLELATRLRDLGLPVYITLDIDGVDPAQMPGTGTPEPAGLAFDAVENALGRLLGAHIVGADLVETAPPLDPTGVTAVAAARLARTLLLLLCRGDDMS